MTPKLGKMKRVPLREGWLSEASHFTPWLASEEGLELLQETLDMELEVEAIEQFVGPFRADILAKRTDVTDDHWVLIENQLERTDHRHLGQLLTYAAGLDAATIVWVAENFAEEHRAALDWLNKITSEEFEFYGLQVELWQIEGSPPAPLFKVIAHPNEWTREVKQKAGRTVAASGTKELQQRFWQTLNDRLVEKQSAIRPQRAGPRSFAKYAIGRSQIWLATSINTLKQLIWVELAIEGPPGKVWFDQLFAQKAEIEAEIGTALDWQRLEGKHMSRIAIIRPHSDISDESDWPAQVA